MVLEAGAPGVDAAAVTDALVSLRRDSQDTSDSEGSCDEHITCDGRPLVFARLSYDALQKAAAAAADGDPLFAANAAVDAAAEAHASSDDPEKGLFFVPPPLIAGLFLAFCETEKRAYRAAIAARRADALASAEAKLEAAEAEALAAVETARQAATDFDRRRKEHDVLMSRWNRDDEDDDGPGPGPDPDSVAEAVAKARSAKERARSARRAVAAAARARSKPAEVCKTYALA